MIHRPFVERFPLTFLLPRFLVTFAASSIFASCSKRRYDFPECRNTRGNPRSKVNIGLYRCPSGGGYYFLFSPRSTRPLKKPPPAFYGAIPERLKSRYAISKPLRKGSRSLEQPINRISRDYPPLVTNRFTSIFFPTVSPVILAKGVYASRGKTAPSRFDASKPFFLSLSAFFFHSFISYFYRSRISRGCKGHIGGFERHDQRTLLDNGARCLG